eukprot:13547430-Ditylum_brightwellii.AAC.1
MSSDTGSSGTTAPTGSNGNSNNNTTETSSGSSPPNNNNQTNNSQGNNNIQRNNTRSVMSILQDADRDLKGKMPEIGGVLVLKSERINKKVPFETVRELSVAYLMKELDRAQDVIPIVRGMTDPKPILIKRYKVKDLSDKDKKSNTKKEMHKTS